MFSILTATPDFQRDDPAGEVHVLDDALRVVEGDAPCPQVVRELDGELEGLYLVPPSGHGHIWGVYVPNVQSGPGGDGFQLVHVSGRVGGSHHILEAFESGSLG